MEEVNIENLEVEEVVVPGDSRGDLIATLFQAGFSDEEIDIVLEAYNAFVLAPPGELMLDEEIIKIADNFEARNLELGEDDLAIIRNEFKKITG